MKYTVILLSGVLALALGGCTNSFSKVRSTVAEAPDWYKDKRAAISDAGYPKVGRVPELTKAAIPGRTLEASRSQIEAARARFADNPRAALPVTTPAEIRAEALEIRRRVGAMNTPTDFLTDAEIAEIRNTFNIGRAKLNF